KPNVTFIIIRGCIPYNACRSYSPPSKTVVRNSFLKGSWGSEERDLPFNPFQYEQYFELLIHCDQYRFIVYANDEYFFSYAHRYIHFPQIKILEIIGDILSSW
uniref:Galectin n=1 Tax=Naja naja TaxID=35670 RepID=A0A8C7E794_NAJNA